MVSDYNFRNKIIISSKMAAVPNDDDDKRLYSKGRRIDTVPEEDQRTYKILNDLHSQWNDMADYFIKANLLQVSPIAVLQIMDFGTLYAYYKAQGSEESKKKLDTFNEENIVLELLKHVNPDLIKIYLETMISQLEGLKENLPILRAELTQTFIDTLPYQDAISRHRIDDQVTYIMSAYDKAVVQIPEYKAYLAKWLRIIPNSSLYKSRTIDFVRASIRLIKDENYKFNNRDLFSTFGSNPKFFQ
jgi:hypothetical protein